MIVTGIISKFNPKSAETVPKGKPRYKYDNILVELTSDETNEDELKEFGLDIKSFKDKKFVSLNIVSTSEVDKDKLNNEYSGEFTIAMSHSKLGKAKSIPYVAKARLEHLFA